MAIGDAYGWGHSVSHTLFSGFIVKEYDMSRDM